MYVCVYNMYNVMHVNVNGHMIICSSFLYIFIRVLCYGRVMKNYCLRAGRRVLIVME